MRTYNIPEIPDVTETLKLISNVEAWTARLKEMQALQEDIKKDLAARRKYEELDDAIGQARSKVTEAETIRKQADTYAARSKEEADKKSYTILQQAAAVEAEIKAKKAALEKRAADLDAKHAELDGRETMLREKANAAAALSLKAQALMAQAESLRSEFQAKLKRVQEAVG